MVLITGRQIWLATGGFILSVYDCPVCRHCFLFSVSGECCWSVGDGGGDDGGDVGADSDGAHQPNGNERIQRELIKLMTAASRVTD